VDEIFARTSVTLDEAVAILLGWVNGPIRFSPVSENPSDADLDELDSLTYSLQDDLTDRRDEFESALEEARNDRLPALVIEEKRASLAEFDQAKQKAAAYLCAIKDELNRGESSLLQLDRELSNSVYKFITMTSLDQWAKARYGKVILPQIEQPAAAAVNPKPKQPVIRRRMREQEEAILSKIEEQGYSAKSLPRKEPGKRGVKVAVREKLAGDPIFEAAKAFDKAWERLRYEGSIADQV